MSHSRKPIQRPLQLAICLAILVSATASAGELEDNVKGGYLYNFTKYVEWPSLAFSGPDAPFVIGILGDDPFGPAFDEALKSETSQGRKINVRRIRRVEDAAGCHVLFVCRSEGRLLPDIIKHLKDTPVLTVGDGGRFARQGGVIEFVIVDGKVRFAINVDAEKRSKLKISSELKRVAAEIVRE